MQDRDDFQALPEPHPNDPQHRPLAQPQHGPLDPLVAEIVGRLDENLREMFEERAGIIEFDAGLPRAHAECLALLGVLYRPPAVLTGVIAIEIEEEGEASKQGTKRWLLTSDVDALGRDPRRHFTVVRTAQLADVLREHFDGLAAMVRADRS